MSNGAKVSIWLSAEAKTAWDDLKRSNFDFSLSKNVSDMLIALSAQRFGVSSVARPNALTEPRRQDPDDEEFDEIERLLRG